MKVAEWATMCIKGNNDFCWQRQFHKENIPKNIENLHRAYNSPVYITQRKLAELGLSGEILHQCKSIQPRYYVVK